MGTELRYPNITGATEREMVAQMKGYLHQLVDQLQYALNNAGNTSVTYVTQKVVGQASSSGDIDTNVLFNDIKSLIIKSADIVDAYYEEINKRLEGAYVSESDFGVFAEQTSQEIQANSAAITQSFNNTQAIIQTEVEALSTELKGYTDQSASTLGDQIGEAASDLESKIAEANARIDSTSGDVEDLGTALDDAKARLDSTEESLETAKADMTGAIQKVSESLSETDKLVESTKNYLLGSLENLQFYVSNLEQIVLGVTAYIRSGILYYTDGGAPVYGIEIGQEVEADGEKVFNKFSRFTSEKLSFYDQNDNEVAYISDKKLYIGQAQITISQQIGGFIDLVLANGDVVEKWIGG